jgi:hypothetical protein
MEPSSAKMMNLTKNSKMIECRLMLKCRPFKTDMQAFRWRKAGKHVNMI